MRRAERLFYKNPCATQHKCELGPNQDDGPMQEAMGRLGQATQRLARQISEDFENGRRAARADVERLAMKWAQET